MTKTIASIGEDGIIKLIREVAQICRCPLSRLLGVDDVAVSAVSDLNLASQLVWTTDSMQEGSHFRFWTLLEDYPANWLGEKLALVNLSDIAAKGAIPRYALLNLGLPKNTELQRVREFLEGLLKTLARHEVTLLGGDTYGTTTWNIGLTLVGELPPPQHLPSRQRANAGDFLYVSGALGASRHGLMLLEKGLEGNEKANELIPPSVFAHLIPPDRMALGNALIQICPYLAMMDCSDGLLNDATKMATASRVGVSLYGPSIPIDARILDYGVSQEDALRHALIGGEDYELLFATSLPQTELVATLAHYGVNVPISQIGIFTSDQHVEVLDENNRPMKLHELEFYKHF